ncbi:hypothetical protein V3C99_008710 [Haemonchus contortus]
MYIKCAYVSAYIVYICVSIYVCVYVCACMAAFIVHDLARERASERSGQIQLMSRDKEDDAADTNTSSTRPKDEQLKKKPKIVKSHVMYVRDAKAERKTPRAPHEAEKDNKANVNLKQLRNFVTDIHTYRQTDGQTDRQTDRLSAL